jgi:hypothetical protein
MVNDGFVGLVPIVYLLLFVPWLIVEAALPLTGDLTQCHDVAVGDPLIAQLITYDAFPITADPEFGEAERVRYSGKHKKS